MEICDRTFELVADQLTSLNYSGPVGLSCDDTKLFSCLRLYWDAQQHSHFLVGGMNGPVCVADPEQMREVIKEAGIQKATKVRQVSLLPTRNLKAAFFVQGAALVFDDSSSKGYSYCCCRPSHSEQPQCRNSSDLS